MTTMTGNQTENLQRETTRANQRNLERAARAYRLALFTKDDAARVADEFPTASKKLEEVARLLVSEGKKAEAAAIET